MKRWIASTPHMAGCLLVLALAGCGLQKSGSRTVLQSSDFIADPTTMPTERKPTPVVAEPPAPAAMSAPVAAAGAAQDPEARVAPQLTPEEASEGIFDVAVAAGDPMLAPAAAPEMGEPVVVDAKVGEINGRPVRLEDMMAQLGPRLRAAASQRRLTEDDWAVLRMTPQPGPIDRAMWATFARALFQTRLELTLRDELLEAEARASLKPEQQMGLRYMVQEFADQQRRQSGGSQAALNRRLREANMTEQQLKRDREAITLIQYQHQQQIMSRVRVSWKDVQLWYERNYDRYNPPATARFRMIQTDSPEAAARVQAALEAKEVTFEELARGEDNRFSPQSGGLWGERTFGGSYAEAEFFAEPLNTAARGLSEGRWAGPVDVNGRSTWLYLDDLSQEKRLLSDRDVQLDIAKELREQGEKREMTRYIDRLKLRASFSDLDAMADRLTRYAAARYWPE